MGQAEEAEDQGKELLCEMAAIGRNQWCQQLTVFARRAQVIAGVRRRHGLM